MFGPVISFQRFGDNVAAGAHAPITQLRQRDGISISSKNRIQNAQTAPSGDFAQHLMDLQIHLIERLLNVLRVLTRHLDQTLAVSPERPDRTNFRWWTEARTQQTHGMEILNPLTIGDIALPTRNIPDVLRID